MTLAIETVDLIKKYNNFKALDELNLEVGKGMIYGFLGPNGAGKTTTIKILMGLLKADGGSAFLLGEDVESDGAKTRFNVGYMPELPSFPSHLSGPELLDIYGQLYGLSKSERKRKAEELLELVDLSQRKDGRIDTYSKGMQQRLGIAQSLIADPELLVLDEPTAGLDPEGRAEVRDIIRKIGDEGVTVFLSSHLLEEVQKICSHVTIINHGTSVMSGSMEEISKDFSGRSEVVVEVEKPKKGLISSLRELSGVVKVDREGRELTVVVEGEEDLRGEISRTIVREGGAILEMRTKKHSLEDVFLKVTREEKSDE
ncbi:hypothetical protein AKJ65_04530 [candidate division MSBL1 archaeon SCGC-AAA259E19]|uniref:ABC transporter domain-containing protein n=1 Tax=candidate division MSBL1 archaeon SCGC-AAA259E19 TaxID=1698264 RepID=A0A133UJL0_9EURY|nr:hypothetical protein AKJ65_04530 [candidate division MSBL1 archaeon SCGC-AAA259E19]